MTLSIVILAFSAALAAVLGFAAHRANICTVKAVEEVLTTRHAFMLLSFGKTVLWVILITSVLTWFIPSVVVVHWKLSYFSILGGFLFGIGATLNGGCAFSMLAKLANGRLSQLIALVGFGAGAAGFLLLAPEFMTPVAELAHDPRLQEGNWFLVILAGLAIWAIWEVTRIWNRFSGSHASGTALFSKHYSLSTAAILIGVSNAVLYAVYGAWAYTGVLNGSIKNLLNDFGPVGIIYWLLFISLFFGMAISAWQSGTLALHWQPSISWVHNLFGGLLMGFGVAMVPGGNDVLILNGIPSLSPHAVPAFLAVLAGIAATLSIVRWTGGKIETIDCSSDFCVVRE